MLTLTAVYVHAIDPYAIKLWEGGPIRWYGLSYLAGFLIAYWIIRQMARTGRSPLGPNGVGDFVVAVAIGVVVGGRLGYVLFYRPDMLWTWTRNPPFWDVLAINKGGMASHGGMIGTAVACLWHARRTAHQGAGPVHLLDLVAFTAPVGLFFGRLANFVNGELIGVECSPRLPWAVKFPQEMLTWDPDAVAKLAPAARLLGPLSFPTDIGFRIPQMIDQIQNGNRPLVAMIEPLLAPRHPSQIYQALLEGLVLFVVLALVWTKPQKPGLIGGLFCVAYGVLRVIGECFRQPDAHLGYQWLGLSRGQWLSLVLLFTGLVVTVWSMRRQSQPLGGWLANGPTGQGQPSKNG